MDKAKYSRYYTYIKPVIQNPLVKSVAPHIFSLITIAVFTVFVIRPTINTIIELNNKIADSQNMLAALKEKSQNLGTGRINYDQIDPVIKQKIGQALPDQPNVPHLVYNLRQAGYQTATISALQIQPVTIIDDATATANLAVADLEFSFSYQGGYSQLLGILSKLNRLSRVVEITNLVISKQPDQPASLSITGKAFYLN